MKRISLACLSLLLLFAFAGCAEPPTVKVTPRMKLTAPHRDVSGSHLMDFGKVPVLHRSTLTLTIESLSRAKLKIDSFEIEGAEGIFLVGEDPTGLSLSNSESVEVSITFQPSEETDFLGKIRIQTNDPGQTMVEVDLEGTGSTVGRVEIEPRDIDFGIVGEWTQEVRNIRIVSVGTASLLIESVEWVEGSSDAFLVLGSTRPTELPPPGDGHPGGEVVLSLACAPTAATEGKDLEGTLRLVTSDPQNREVLVRVSATVNRAPIAVFEIDPANHAPNLPVRLDGTESYDPDGYIPDDQYDWIVVKAELGATWEFANLKSATPTLTVSQPGDYVIGLWVKDDQGLSCYSPGGDPDAPCAKKTVSILSEDDLIIELVWTHAITDLDLHLLDTGADINTVKDCFWANPEPDFGIIGDLSDDPRFVRESLKGFGPEEIVFSKPSGGTYKVAVDFSKANGATNLITDAIVRVYVYGKLEAEMRGTLEEPGQIWDVLTIDWPSAVVTEIDEIRGKVIAP